jgi:hypothetical protein
MSEITKIAVPETKISAEVQINSNDLVNIAVCDLENEIHERKDTLTKLIKKNEQAHNEAQEIVRTLVDSAGGQPQVLSLIQFLEKEIGIKTKVSRCIFDEKTITVLVTSSGRDNSSEATQVPVKIDPVQVKDLPQAIKSRDNVALVGLTLKEDLLKCQEALSSMPRFQRNLNAAVARKHLKTTQNGSEMLAALEEKKTEIFGSLQIQDLTQK